MSDIQNKLISQYQESKRESILLKLIKLNEGAIIGTAYKFGGDHEINIQNMKLGFVNAVQSFDTTSSNNFLTYAIYQMMGSNSVYNKLSKSDKEFNNCKDLVYQNSAVEEVEVIIPFTDTIEKDLNSSMNIRVVMRMMKKYYRTHRLKTDDGFKRVYKLYLTGNYTLREIDSITKNNKEWFRNKNIKFNNFLRKNITIEELI